MTAALKPKPERLPPEDARQTARLTVEQLADGFGTRTRVMSQCEVLERRGSLTPRQARAGARIYASWALGICGARNSDATGNGSDPGGYTDAQIDAASEYRRIRDAVGGRLWPLTFHCCCLDWSPSRFANDLGAGMHKAGALALLRHALDLAGDAIGDE